MKIHSSVYWKNYFTSNSKIIRVDWSLKPDLTDFERKSILKSLQAWQLGETSEGEHLLHTAKKYAATIDDDEYPNAVKLFIKEEQKHGHNLGQYLDLIEEPRIKKDWGDTLFRKIRYFNTNMELWTIAVITVESAARIFYQALKDATNCKLLKQICTDILIDEAAHITFQKERLYIIFNQKNAFPRWLAYYAYSCFYICTSLVVWFGHKTLFKAGKLNFFRYFSKMRFKLKKVAGKSVLYEPNEFENQLTKFSQTTYL
ncbi:ferritin-like domain-containing protein [Pedobacter punctiformis]|uniref:Ferritin-like domain-containing protein n=1 Tax=Pedobacter punctiformis TaxID=3004097 RepID=A0ABT4L8T4_9SPHI|nr:ferritin-like domain-containing protein [Pedobacter sp. HCMS5-2]MCZ4244332.1 ferritin-like domain-containing protein [Pedobacter sp. HCMS5-2]